MERKNKGTFWSDTIAIGIIYAACGGILPMISEMGILRFTFLQWSGLHCLYSCRNILVGRICGIMTNYFQQYFCKKIADLLAIYICELPLYVAFSLLNGINKKQIVCGVGVQLANNAILVGSGLFDLILEKTRQYFASRKQTK